MKRVLRYFSEMTFAMIMIFVSYFAWDRIDVEAYEKYITQYTLDDVAISVDDEFNQLTYVSEVDNVDLSILSVNNYQDRKYNVNVMLELDSVNDNIINNLILFVDSDLYNLDDIYSHKIEDKYYFLIVNVNLLEYEKKSYNLKLLVKDDYEFVDLESFSYSIIEEIV